MPLHFAVELDLISLITTSDSERLPTGNSGANSLTEWKVGKKKTERMKKVWKEDPTFHPTSDLVESLLTEDFSKTNYIPQSNFLFSQLSTTSSLELK